ncbi:TetR/AcrR family transcriptional regulator [Apilactobacillus kunkeei]|uniref:TetR/AcrR family transcriptional regulator n=1 Tax=Apilactobacillus kunkeei TaxID=148814 RepID=UPI0030E916F9
MIVKNKTKKKIVDAFLNLSGKIDIEDISINSIINITGISRGTFYNHFKNKKDILSFIEINLCHEIDMAFEEVNSHHPKTFHDFIRGILPVLYENREYNKVLLTYYQSNFYDFVLKRYNEYVLPYFDHYDEKIIGVPKYFMVKFFSMTIMTVIFLWLTEPIPLPPKDFEPAFIKIINSSIKDVCDIKFS